eukprot:gene8750-3511_t
MSSEKPDIYRKASTAIRSTGGAVSVLNAKGERTLQKVHVARHRAGVRPKFAEEDEDSSGDDEHDALGAIAQQQEEMYSIGSTATTADLGALDPSDRRLARLQSGTDGSGASADTSGDDAFSESEYETDSESEDEMLKPVFVSKTQRVTQLEREARETLEAEKAKNAVEVQKARVKESQALVIDVMQAELNDEHMQLLKITDIDDDDETYNEAAEAAIEAERLEVERLRDMTEEERLVELEKRKKAEGKQPDKGKMKFMQKYYHKGAFFMDKEEEIYTRDTSEATGDDHFDKAALPKVMQVKTGMFGKIGQTKYTHLKDQDTSSKDSLWNGGLAREGRGGGQDGSGGGGGGVCYDHQKGACTRGDSCRFSHDGAGGGGGGGGRDEGWTSGGGGGYGGGSGSRNAQKSKRGGAGDVFERPSSKRRRD